MFTKLFLCSLITLVISEVISPLENKAAHNNNLINKFCIASLKSKLKYNDKQKLDEISHYTCECFLKKFKSTKSIKTSRIYCKNKTIKKYNL